MRKRTVLMRLCGEKQVFKEEYYIQSDVIHWLKSNHPGVLFTIAPNGMKLPIQTAVKLKKMGYSPGTPDIMIFEPRGLFHGLFIELKTETGTTSLEQKEWNKRLISRGYCSIVCRSASEAMNYISKYLFEEA